VVGERKDYYYIITGNVVKAQKVPKLERQLEKLNGMEIGDLVKLHKAQMMDGEISEKGGAGLGLIDMIRKTGEKYIYQFLKLDMENHYFILKVTVPKK
jgi:hypothetical protein